MPRTRQPRGAFANTINEPLNVQRTESFIGLATKPREDRLEAGHLTEATNCFIENSGYARCRPGAQLLYNAATDPPGTSTGLPLPQYMKIASFEADEGWECQNLNDTISGGTVRTYLTKVLPFSSLQSQEGHSCYVLYRTGGGGITTTTVNSNTTRTYPVLSLNFSTAEEVRVRLASDDFTMLTKVVFKMRVGTTVKLEARYDLPGGLTNGLWNDVGLTVTSGAISDCSGINNIVIEVTWTANVGDAFIALDDLRGEISDATKVFFPAGGVAGVSSSKNYIVRSIVGTIDDAARANDASYGGRNKTEFIRSQYGRITATNTTRHPLFATATDVFKLTEIGFTPAIVSPPHNFEVRGYNDASGSYPNGSVYGVEVTFVDEQGQESNPYPYKHPTANTRKTVTVTAPADALEIFIPPDLGNYKKARVYRTLAASGAVDVNTATVYRIGEVSIGATSLPIKLTHTNGTLTAAELATPPPPISGGTRPDPVGEVNDSSWLTLPPGTRNPEWSGARQVVRSYAKRSWVLRAFNAYTAGVVSEGSVFLDFSKSGQYDLFPATNRIPITTFKNQTQFGSSTDVHPGMETLQGSLYVFVPGAIYRVSDVGAKLTHTNGGHQMLPEFKKVQDVGCNSPLTIVNIEDSFILFLGGTTVYKFNGTTVEPVGDIIKNVFTGDDRQTVPNNMHKACAVHIESENQYLIVIPVDGGRASAVTECRDNPVDEADTVDPDGVANTGYCFNYKTGAWAGPWPNFFASQFSQSHTGIIFSSSAPSASIHKLTDPAPSSHTLYDGRYLEPRICSVVTSQNKFDANSLFTAVSSYIGTPIIFGTITNISFPIADYVLAGPNRLVFQMWYNFPTTIAAGPSPVFQGGWYKQEIVTALTDFGVTEFAKGLRFLLAYMRSDFAAVPTKFDGSAVTQIATQRFDALATNNIRRSGQVPAVSYGGSFAPSTTDDLLNASTSRIGRFFRAHFRRSEPALTSGAEFPAGLCVGGLTWKWYPYSFRASDSVRLT